MAILDAGPVRQLHRWVGKDRGDRQAIYIFPTHDERILEHASYPYSGGMPVRERRKMDHGTSFFFSSIERRQV